MCRMPNMSPLGHKLRTEKHQRLPRQIDALLGCNRKHVDVRILEHVLRVPGCSYLDHSPTDVCRCGDMTWQEAFQQGIERREDVVECLIQLRFRADTLERLNEPRTEHVGIEGHSQEVVFRLALDPRPHEASALRAVGTLTGDVAEGKSRVEVSQSRGCGDSQLVRQTVISRLGHPHSGHPKTEKTGIKALQMGIGVPVVKEVRTDELPELRMGNAAWRAPHHQH